MEASRIPFAQAWLSALTTILNAFGNTHRYRSAHAYGPTPSRQRHGYGRSRWEGHRIRKAKRLEPLP